MNFTSPFLDQFTLGGYNTHNDYSTEVYSYECGRIQKLGALGRIFGLSSIKPGALLVKTLKLTNGDTKPIKLNWCVFTLKQFKILVKKKRG
jgi:hypothetical protein